MKILVIPDIHLKPDIIKRAEAKMYMHKYDNAVFLGDFADDWNKGRNIGLYEDTYDALNEFMTKFPDSLVCYGNHDVSYVWGFHETGFSSMARDTVKFKLKELVKKHGDDRFKFIYKIDNVLFSHAGLTKGFVMQHFSYDTDCTIEHIIETINNMPKYSLWENSSPIWARPEDGYYFYSKGYLQVVGHTPVRAPKFYEEHNLLVCDTFSTYSNGCTIGNEKFVVVDTETKEWKEVK